MGLHYCSCDDDDVCLLFCFFVWSMWEDSWFVFFDKNVV